MINSNLKPQDAGALYDLLKVVSDPAESKKRIDQFIKAREDARDEQAKATSLVNDARKLMAEATAAMGKVKSDNEALTRAKSKHSLDVEKFDKEKHEFRTKKASHEDWYEKESKRLKDIEVLAEEHLNRAEYMKNDAQSMLNQAESMKRDYEEKIRKLKEIV
ncbi:MAG: hypothetical protein GTN99_11285 [Candidatus Dadabacteria bacterium]|nr:hypothetical protein [Candidatus Dadabacteria bacterium]